MRYKLEDDSRMVMAVIAAVTAVEAASMGWFVASIPSAHPDFVMLWTAARSPHPYDFDVLRSALHWEPTDLVAFVYPPSALPVFALFGLFSFRIALTLWAGLSGLALAFSSRSKLAPLLILTPPALWALPGGQTSVLLGSILFGAVLLLDRSILAGLLLGVAISLKPQLSIVLPLALLAVRKWDVLVVAITTFVAMTLLSAAVFGVDQWLAWIRTLPTFLLMHEASSILRRNEIAFGLPLWVRIAALGIGVWLTARGIEQEDYLQAFVSAVGSALIASSHAMGYEFAMFLPAFPALAARRGLASIAAAIFILTPAFIWISPGLLEFYPRLASLVFLVGAVAASGIKVKPPILPTSRNHLTM